MTEEFGFISVNIRRKVEGKLWQNALVNTEKTMFYYQQINLESSTAVCNKQNNRQKTFY